VTDHYKAPLLSSAFPNNRPSHVYLPLDVSVRISQPDVLKPQRRHDLDALRAFAMLLGIVLHVGSAFTPTGAFGRGSSAPWFGHAIGLIHGFRMQLFFMVSGFFTMMLLRRRGAWAVSRQRALRIALPLLLGMFTVIPAANWATEWANQRQQSSQPAPAPTLAAAVQSRDGNAVQALISDPAQIDRPDPLRGVTPLIWAVLNNDLPTARLLLDHGARIVRASRGNTPLHYAALLGRRDIAELLLLRGAKPSATNSAGQTAIAMTDYSWNDTRFAVYIAGGHSGDHSVVEAGRQQVKELFAQFVPAPARVAQAAKPALPVTRPVALPQTRPSSPATRPAPKIAAATQPTRAPATGPLAQAAGTARPATRPATRPQTQPVAAAKPPAPATPQAPARPPAPDLAQRYMTFMSSPTFRIWLNDEPVQIFTTPIFRHLWFLWFLCWLTPGLFLAVWATDALSLRIPRWLVTSPLCLLWLIPLTLLPQWFMRHPAYLFGPETSSGWIPMPHVLLFYAIFFGFGAMYYACGDFASDGTADRPAAPTSRWRDVTRWWWLSLPLALAVAYPLGKAYSSSRSATSLAITIYGWLMIFGLIGLFRAMLKTESKGIRYLSDASYWLYLTHMMPIPIMQFLLRDSPMAAPWKFLLMCLAIALGLLIVYDLLIRYTFIGAMLNGRKMRPALFHRPVAPAEAQAQP